MRRCAAGACAAGACACAACACACACALLLLGGCAGQQAVAPDAVSQEVAQGYAEAQLPVVRVLAHHAAHQRMARTASAVVLSPQRVLTCRHVADDMRSLQGTEPLQLVVQERQCTATVLRVGPQGWGGDWAVLELGGSAGAVLAPPCAIPAKEPAAVGDRVLLAGYPTGEQGARVTAAGTVVDVAPDGAMTISGLAAANGPLEIGTHLAGMSGGAVLRVDQDGTAPVLVGVIAAVKEVTTLWQHEWTVMAAPVSAGLLQSAGAPAAAGAQASQAKEGHRAGAG